MPVFSRCFRRRLLGRIRKTHHIVHNIPDLLVFQALSAEGRHWRSFDPRIHPAEQIDGPTAASILTQCQVSRLELKSPFVMQTAFCVGFLGDRILPEVFVCVAVTATCRTVACVALCFVRHEQQPAPFARLGRVFDAMHVGDNDHFCFFGSSPCVGQEIGRFIDRAGVVFFQILGKLDGSGFQRILQADRLFGRFFVLDLLVKVPLSFGDR